MTMMTSYVLSIDLGSTACKVLIFNEKGDVISRTECSYPLYTPRPGYAEEDPLAWKTSVFDSIRKVLLKSGLPASSIDGIVVTGQAISLTPIDKRGNPIKSAILTFMDSRTDSIRREIAPRYSMNYPEMMVFSTLIWMREKEKPVYEKMDKIIDARNFIIFLLTNRVTYDAISIPKERMEFLSKEFGFDLDLFGDAHSNYFNRVGETTREVEERLGIPQGTPVFLAPWDGMCNVIGSGLIKDGIAMDVTGTTEIIATAVSKRASIVTHKHLIEGLWLVYMSTPLAIAHRWFVEKILEGRELNGLSTYDIVDYLSEKAEIQKTPIFLPTFKGEYFKPNLKGAVIGLDFDTDSRHLARSIMEGVSFYVRMKLEYFEENGLHISEVITSGGGAKSRIWNQIKADIFKRSVKIPHTTETASLGAAMIAFTALRKYSSLTDAIKSMLRIKEIFHPKKEVSKIYEEKYRRFKLLYNFMSEL